MTGGVITRSVVDVITGPIHARRTVAIRVSPTTGRCHLYHQVLVVRPARCSVVGRSRQVAGGAIRVHGIGIRVGKVGPAHTGVPSGPRAGGKNSVLMAGTAPEARNGAIRPDRRRDAVVAHDVGTGGIAVPAGGRSA